MGLFSKLFSGVPSQPVVKLNSEKEAFFAIIYACIAVDGNIDDEEIADFVSYVQSNAYLRGMRTIEVYRNMVILKQKHGIEAIVSAALPMIAEKRKPSLFVAAVDMILADGVVDKKEETLLEDIQKGLGISDELAGKVVEVIMIKNSIG